MTMSLSAVLFIVFLVLKLVGVIAWSWWWVTAPLWIGLILFAISAVFLWHFGASLFNRLVNGIFNKMNRF